MAHAVCVAALLTQRAPKSEHGAMQKSENTNPNTTWRLASYEVPEPPKVIVPEPPKELSDRRVRHAVRRG